MKRLVFDRSAEVAEWARRHIADISAWGDCSAIGLEEDGQLIAATVFTRYLPGINIDMSVAAEPGKRWSTPDFVRACFAYPFRQLGVRRVTSLIPAWNQASIRYCRHVGFSLEGVIREGGARGEDLLLFGMLAKDCKWLNQETVDRGQIVSISSPAA